MSSTLSPTRSWLDSLSPWPEEFGLDRMRALVRDLGDPQRAYPTIHVVGTNGKTTATRTIAAFLRSEGLRVGAYTSPHVSGWHERLDTDPDTFDRAVERVRPYADGATQFEVLTAAALADFREQGVDVAVVEAGLGGRLDATNVIDAQVVHLTNVGLDHTDVLGSTREAIAREKLAVVKPGAVVVVGEPEWTRLVPGAGRVQIGGARETAEAFVNHAIAADVDVRVPGRLEWRGPNEVWDGAHNVEGLVFQASQLPERSDWIVVASILADKDADAMLELLGRRGRTLIATRSSSGRALDEKELARRAEPYFERVFADPDPESAVGRARGLGAVLVTGSLYLLADLARCN